MPNYSAKILNNATSALGAQQAIIANTSNNIANVNTPGYSRRTVNLETVGGRNASSTGIDVGNGVKVSGIQRVADTFINESLRNTGGRQASSQIQNDFLGRIDRLFSLTGDQPTISKNLNAFFTAVNDLTVSPSDIELRKNVIERANDLVSSITTTYNALANMQTEADSRLQTEIQTVNTLTEQIAAANVDISATERGSGIEASDARDRRDRLLEELAKKISFQTVEQSDGSMNVYLSNGFTLVSGNHNTKLGTTTSPSFATGPLPPSLSGGLLSYVTYDYSNGAGTGDFDLTQVLSNGEGSVGALLKVRGYNDPSNTSAFEADGTIVEVASRIEALTRVLLDEVNTRYFGPDEDSGTSGVQSSATDLDGNPPPLYGLFDFAGATDTGGNGVINLADFSNGNFSSVLRVAVSDPRRLAAGRDQDAAAGAITAVRGDGSNMSALAALQGETIGFDSQSYSLNGTFDDFYSETVTHVSARKSAMQSRASLDEDNLLTIQTQRDEVSGVSLDEEFSGLIRFQQAYQASAKMIKIADDLINTILGLI